jgi:isoleucyl-tRNA synthetase
MSPVAPFFGDWLYRRLNEVAGRAPHVSVHLSRFPVCDETVVRPELERRMTLARRIVQLVLFLRNRCQINVRQPLRRILLVRGAGIDPETVAPVADLIRDEVNVRAIEFVDDSSGVVTRSAKADFRKLGPRLGKRMKAVAGAVAALGDADIRRLQETGSVDVPIEGGTVTIAADEVEVTSEEIGDWSVAQEGTLTVALDTGIDAELRAQGYAREAVNRIQALRKAADLELTERIRVELNPSPALAAAIRANADFIRQETLALELIEVAEPAGERVERYEIGNEQLVVGLTRMRYK